MHKPYRINRFRSSQTAGYRSQNPTSPQLLRAELIGTSLTLLDATTAKQGYAKQRLDLTLAPNPMDVTLPSTQ